ncbi:MAG: hypothetical protein NC299_03075 [Lachnospiraceae bacterium]|nr:hypothetical protein [Ruminococcus sp.]MCM1274334.1 hypothetical protein [Lachnospiraceae bacterium]
MFGFFRKNIKTEEDRRAESLPLTKKVQFEAVPLKQVETALESDIRAVLGFTPVNYYATKEKYLLCIFYYREDYSEIFIRFEYRVDDLPRGKTKLWSVDRDLMRDILRKFGQNI